MALGLEKPFGLASAVGTLGSKELVIAALTWFNLSFIYLNQTSIYFTSNLIRGIVDHRPSVWCFGAVNKLVLWLILEHGPHDLCGSD